MEDYSCRDFQKKTPLIAASLFGCEKAAHLMLELKSEADKQLHAQDDAGYNALDYAFLLGRTSLVIALLKKGAKFSSDTIIRSCHTPELITWLFDRSIICPERSVDAVTSYLYDKETTLPLMVSKDAGHSWQFIIMHPTNENAKELLRSEKKDLLYPSSITFFNSLRSTTTVGEQRTNALKDPIFLKQTAFLLARLGYAEFLIALLETNPEIDCIHHEDINLIMACTNSHKITQFHSPMDCRTAKEIIDGRKKIVEYLCSTDHAVLCNELCKTSKGMETFSQVVTRMKNSMHEIQQPPTVSTSTEVSFNIALYNMLAAYTVVDKQADEAPRLMPS